MFTKNNLLWLGIFIIGMFILEGFCAPLVIGTARSGSVGSIVVLLIYLAFGIGWLVLCVTGARKGWLDSKPDEKNPDDKPPTPS